MPEDDRFEENRRQARELLAQEDVDGLYVGVTRGDEMDFAYAHQFDDAESVGMRALSILAQHVLVVADEADLEPERVADDAATLAARLSPE